MLYPEYTTKEIVESPQEEARKLWQDVEHPELGTTIKYMAPFAALSETPITIYRRPPLIGEHNEEIYAGELRLSHDELVMLKGAQVI